MVKKGIRGGICHSTHQYQKANNKFMKKNNYDKNKESSYFNYCDINNLYGWVKSQKMPANGFKWVKNKSQFKDIIKNYNEDREGFFLKLMLNILKNDMTFKMIYPFYQKE